MVPSEAITRDAVVLLPHREGLPLADGDVQAVGIELQDRGIRDPGIGFQARARGFGIEKQQRAFSGDAGGGEHLLARDFLRPADRDRGDAEAGGVGGGIARIAQLRRDGVDMPAIDRAASAGDQKHGDGRGGAGAARNIQIEDRTQMRQRVSEGGGS